MGTTTAINGARRRGRRWNGASIKRNNFTTMNPARTTTHVMVPLHVWIKKASFKSTTQKQHDQYKPRPKSQPIFFFFFSCFYVSKLSKAISVCGVDCRSVNVGVKNEACWFGGFYRVEETSFRWWSQSDGTANWWFKNFVCGWTVGHIWDWVGQPIRDGRQ